MLNYWVKCCNIHTLDEGKSSAVSTDTRQATDRTLFTPDTLQLCWLRHTDTHCHRQPLCSLSTGNGSLWLSVLFCFCTGYALTSAGFLLRLVKYFQLSHLKNFARTDCGAVTSHILCSCFYQLDFIPLDRIPPTSVPRKFGQGLMRKRQLQGWMHISMLAHQRGLCVLA